MPIPGGVLTVETAPIAGKELARIERKHGCVKPSVVVKESEPAEAPLHSFFTWENTEAARLWREREAQGIIRSVRVVTVGIEPQEQPVVRAFLNVHASDSEEDFSGQAYISHVKVGQSPDYTQQVLDKAKAELRSWQQRYSDYKLYFEGKHVFDEVEA